MSIPDLVAQNELDTSMVDIIDKNISAILEDGKMMTVLPFDNFDLIVERVRRPSTWRGCGRKIQTASTC